MRRRRPLNRRPLNPRASGQIGNRAQMLLRRAHQMMENGKHDQAAQVFEQLAMSARDFGRHRSATNLFLQAGRAYLLSDNQDKGSECIFSGLEIISNAKKWSALAQIGTRICEELGELGFSQVANEVLKWLKITLPEPIENYPQRTAPSKPIESLPLKCPFCGGALRPGEVDMLDEITAECPYCGSAIR